MRTIKKAVIIFGLSMLITSWLTFMSSFMIAYSSPNKAVLMEINQHGEAIIELIMLLTSFPFILYTALSILIGYLSP